jgi:Helix-turn-helix domain
MIASGLVNNQASTNRMAYSPREFAALFGRHPTWSYRLLYSGKLKAVTNLGRTLIPASELDRLLEMAEAYNPTRTQPGTARNRSRPDDGLT